MSLLENIRNKPHHHRIRLIWIISGIVALILIVAWIIVGQRHLGSSDSSVFDTVSKGIKDIKDNYKKPLNTNIQ